MNVVDRICECCHRVMHHCAPQRRFCEPCQRQRTKESIKRSNLKRTTLLPRGAVFESKFNGKVIVTTCPTCHREGRYPRALVALVQVPFDQIPCSKCYGGRQ